MTVEFTENLDDGKVVDVVCQFCGHQTKHIILKSIERTWDNDDIQGNDSYQVIQCRGCENVSFRSVSRNSEDYFPETAADRGPDFVYTIKLFPHRVSGRIQLESLWSVPYTVSQIYKETFSAIGAGSYILAGLGLRAIVEAVCVAEGSTEWNFHKKIDYLITKNKLTRAGGDLLLHIRDMGNDSAHKATPIRVEDIDIALEIIEGLLKNVYIIPEEAKKLKKKATNH